MSTSNNTFFNKSKPGKTTAFFICLIVAAFLWFLKSLNTVYTQTIKVPVEFKNLPKNKKPASSIPDFLTMDIKASGLKLFFVLLNQPYKKLVIDFNDLRPISKNYIITPASINLKRSLKFETTVKHIIPDTLYFSENNGYQKNVPVKVVSYLKCMSGYGYKKPEVSPAFLTITGDSAAIKRIDSLYTQVFTLDNMNESVNKNLVVLKPNDDIYLSDNKVNLNIIVERLVEKNIQLPINVQNVPLNAKSINCFPSSVKIKFTALQNDFNLSDTTYFKAAVNLNNSKGGKCAVFLSTQPGNVNIISIEPKEAEVLMVRFPSPQVLKK